MPPPPDGGPTRNHAVSHHAQNAPPPPPRLHGMGRTVVSALAVLALSLAPVWPVPPAAAAEASTSTYAPPASPPRVVGSLSGSGLVFKDTLQIEAFDDPKVRGVKLYISNFQIPLTERLASGGRNFFSDPSSASVACAKLGRISVADNVAKGPGGEEVFEESKSLLFKTLRVQRIYDEDANAVVYVSYNTRLDKGSDSNKSRFKSSLCAIGLGGD